MNTDPAFFLYPPKFVLYFFITNAELLKMVDWKEQYHSFVPKGAILNTVYTDTLVSSFEIVAIFYVFQVRGPNSEYRSGSSRKAIYYDSDPVEPVTPSHRYLGIAGAVVAKAVVRCPWLFWPPPAVR